MQKARVIETNKTPFKAVEVDPITLDILESALRNARYEMDAVLFRTAMSPGIREQHDEFPLIADPGRALYRRLGVERRPGSLLSPRALGAAIAGEAAAFRSHSTKRGALGPVKPAGGRLGLPADFLIAPDGRITALKYGQHAYDQWTVDELLDHARPVPA